MIVVLVLGGMQMLMLGVIGEYLWRTLAQTRKIRPLPIVLVGESFWRQAFNVDFLVAEGVIDPEDRDLFWYAESAHDIWESILGWWEKAGAPLI